MCQRRQLAPSFAVGHIRQHCGQRAVSAAKSSTLSSPLPSPLSSTLPPPAVTIAIARPVSRRLTIVTKQAEAAKP